jgi:hypothetical protein
MIIQAAEGRRERFVLVSPAVTGHRCQLQAEAKRSKQEDLRMPAVITATRTILFIFYGDRHP